MQTGVTVAEGAITGTLHYLSSGQLVSDWGAGNFLALKFTDIDATATSVKVGLDPSRGSGLVEIIDDPDKNGVFKISDKDEQKFVVVTSDGIWSLRQEFDLSGLTAEGPIVITTQPESYAGQIGDEVTFTVVATGSSLTYQWQYSSDGGMTWRNSTLSGNNTDTLTTELTEARTAYKFRCVITDGDGNSIASDAVAMSIET